MVSTLHRCPYDNSTISSINKLKIIWPSLFIPSFTFLSFTFHFVLFFKFMSKSRFIDLPGHNIFTEREREREREPSREGVVGWCEFG